MFPNQGQQPYGGYGGQAPPPGPDHGAAYPPGYPAPPQAGGQQPMSSPFGAPPQPGAASTNPFGAAPPQAGGASQNPFGAAPQQPGGFPPQRTSQGGGGFVPHPMGEPMPPPPPTSEEVRMHQAGQQQQGFQQPPSGGVPGPFGHGIQPTQGPVTGINAPQYPAATMGGAGAAPAHQMPTEMQMERYIQDAAMFNSGPHLVAPTIGRPPSTASLKFRANLPIGMCIQPLGIVPAGYPEVKVVNFGAVGTVVRCKRCRTYINPFVTWETNGRRWVCNLCGFASETPNAYYCNLDEQGNRMDRAERPELCSGTVEYIAPGEYMVRPPQPPVFLFLIDVSLASVQSGMLATVVASIKETLEGGLIPNADQRLQVGIITFDNSVQFYKLNPNLTSPQMLVVSDLEELFLPLPDDVLVNATECNTSIISLLDALPNLFKNTTTAEACLGPAIRAAYLAMKHIGGKLCIFTATQPTIGELRLSNGRDNPRWLNTDRESELLRPANEDYKELAAELVRVQISAEIFIATSTFFDIASVAPLAKFTGGDLHYYQGFRSDIQGPKMRGDIMRILTRYTGWEAVMRVRVSRGWKITNFFGHLYVRGVDLLVVPNCHSDQTFSVTVDMEDNITPDPVLFIQAALLYTNSEGERRIRVHTYSCPSTNNLGELINSIDPAAMSSLIASLAIKQALVTNIADGRQLIQTHCQNVVTAQNNFPDVVPILPMYLIGLMKSQAMRAANDVPADMRVYHWMRLESLSPSLQTAYFYPRMISLHNLPTEPLEIDEYGRTILPPMLNLTTESMTPDGVFLLEDGMEMLMWIGRSIDPNICSQIFGISSLDELDCEFAEYAISSAAQGNGKLAQKIMSIIEAIRVERSPGTMRLQCMRHQDPNETRWFTYLYEDRVNGFPVTYQEFLQRMGARPQGQQQQQQAAPAGPPPLRGY